MPIVLYHMPPSAPCRAVRLTAAAVGVNLELKMLNLLDGEQLKPEFIKINPQHVIPTIDDNGFYLWESRAIIAYLVERYAKDDSLYPKDPKKRAVVNQRLFFDEDTLYKAYSDYFYPIMREGVKDEEKFKKIATALEFLDTFLEGQTYVAGKTMTIADITIATTIGQFEIIEYDLSKFKNVSKWFDRVRKEMPKYMEIHEEGMKFFQTVMETFRKRQQENTQ